MLLNVPQIKVSPKLAGAAEKIACLSSVVDNCRLLALQGYLSPADLRLAGLAAIEKIAANAKTASASC